MALICSFVVIVAVSREAVCAEGVAEYKADDVRLILSDGKEKVLKGCRINGRYFCNFSGTLCVHDNNIKALDGNVSKNCGGGALIGNLQGAKDTIQNNISNTASTIDWFKKECKRLISDMSMTDGSGKFIIDSKKLESQTLLSGDTPSKIEKDKTYRFAYEAKYSDNVVKTIYCAINTRIWVSYISTD
ncbi:MAG: hypothetical protein HQL01_13125 [Nitrospirae bacterium]|nr:hypothetical protein [Nitrospirota bacterium]